MLVAVLCNMLGCFKCSIHKNANQRMVRVPRTGLSALILLFIFGPILSAQTIRGTVEGFDSSRTTNVTIMTDTRSDVRVQTINNARQRKAEVAVERALFSLDLHHVVNDSQLATIDVSLMEQLNLEVGQQFKLENPATGRTQHYTIAEARDEGSAMIRMGLAGRRRIGEEDEFNGHIVLTAGDFEFSNLDANRQYYIQVSQSGFNFIREDGETFARPGGSPVRFIAEHVPGLEDGRFVYRWSESVSVSGAEYSSYVNQPFDITILGAENAAGAGRAVSMLYERFGIVLIDGTTPWSNEFAYRLLEMINRLGLWENDLRRPVHEQPNLLLASQWQLTDEIIENDIRVETQAGGNRRVTISTHAFAYATPQIAVIDGQRGRFFSNRLFRAVVRFATNDGTNLRRAAQIMRERYGIAIATDRNFDGVYRRIAVIEEDRSPDVWQTFQPEEVIQLIAMLEEFPDGMRDISFPDRDGGLRYMLRRRNGLQNPIHPNAAAIAWTSANYIEFMETTFRDGDTAEIQRLIIHEKSHFMWAYLFSEELKYEWLKRGGWYRPRPSQVDVDAERRRWQEDMTAWVPPNIDPNRVMDELPDHVHFPATSDTVRISDEWASLSTTQFVTAYAAYFNPDEDMAESMAFFLTNPDLLRSRALPKYEFIRDYIMQGSIYISMFRPDLTFEVLNLYPDYVYPGKINRVETQVIGEPNDPKEVTITLGLHTSDDCMEEDTYCFEGAASGYMRLHSPTGTFYDLYLRPVGGRLSDTLTATFTVPETLAHGWWTPRVITLYDGVGNERQERVSNADFGWQLYINNPLADDVPPRYVRNSMRNQILSPGDPGASANLLSHEKEIVHTWRLIENRSMEGGSVFVRVAHYENEQSRRGYSTDHYGTTRRLPPGQPDGATHVAEVRTRVTRYRRSGDYGPGHIMMRDRALNETSVSFSFNHAHNEEPPLVRVDNPREDLVAPVMNIDACSTESRDEMCLRITARPVNRSNPDGHTVVRLYYWVWENQPLERASGFSGAAVRLRNPQGQVFLFRHGFGRGVQGFSPNSHGRYHSFPDGIRRRFPDADRTTPVQYILELTLPPGSAPGTWGLTEMSINDYSGNTRTYQFTEVVRFDVESR